jgi:TRAP-type mannitol/chloroaromatic compound transport system substrate-binding protein
MDRRTFLKTSTAAAAVTTAGAAVANETMDQQRALLPDLPGQGALGGQLSSPAIATQRHELRFAIPAGVHLADAAETLSREIAAASGGRILLHNRPDEPATATSLASGLVDATFGFISEVCTSPDLALFSGLPGEMALSPSDMLTWHTAAAGDMFLEQAADAFGLIAMIAGHGGAGTGIWADRELGDLRDFASAHVTTTDLGHGDHRRIPSPCRTHSVAAHGEPRTNPTATRYLVSSGHSSPRSGRFSFH